MTKEYPKYVILSQDETLNNWMGKPKYLLLYKKGYKPIFAFNQNTPDIFIKQSRNETKKLINSGKWRIVGEQEIALL